MHTFNGPYEDESTSHIHFPIGGLGAGMFTLDGTGAFSHFSLRHLPNMLLEPLTFSALYLKTPGQGATARVLEGPVPSWKPFHQRDSSGMGAGGTSFGLPRFAKASFQARFPFATVALSDPAIPLEVSLTGWSPFIPGDADTSSWPVAAVEYRFKNKGPEPVEGVYSYHADNFMRVGAEGQSVQGFPGGILLRMEGLPDRPEAEGTWAAWIDSEDARSDAAWFRGSWFDPLTQVWKAISEGRVIQQGAPTEGSASPGGSLYLPFRLAPGEEKTVRLLLAWYVPFTDKRAGNFPPEEEAKPKAEKAFYRPWYPSAFKDISALIREWTAQVEKVHAATKTFTDSFYDSTLPPEVIEAVAANLTILKSPTVLRQFDGRMWAWEGCNDYDGSCHGTCTHVWNYAQALAHLFPDLERGLRETEYFWNQDERGHQDHRANLPISPVQHGFHAAADGQLGGVIKTYREWRISGDLEWVRRLWPKIRQSLQYGITTWDPDHRGILTEPHHNTYDIEFWGADGMCTSFYLAALRAAILIGQALGEDVALYEKLLANGKAYMEGELFNGEYFIQKIQWKGLHSPDPAELSRKKMAWNNVNYSTEAEELLQREGPKYQYGDGCLADGILGEWMAWNAGLAPVVAPAKIEQHLLAVHRYNFCLDISTVPNPQRPGYAFGHEAGLLLCSWPKGGQLTLPMVYSNEVWTGIEYQVASHLISYGHLKEGLEIVQACRRRYDGTIRNPFDEIECGHWYARAMASYALIPALSGARYDAVEKTLHLAPRIRGDFRSFFAAAGGFGVAGVEKGKPFFEVKSGQVDVQRIDYRPA